MLAVVVALVMQGLEPGLYEGVSPLDGLPTGRLDAAPIGLLAGWIEVAPTTRGLAITFQPEGRVTWELEIGAHGPTRKVTRVAGALWTESVFERDQTGALTRKVVTGPGLAAPLVEAYRVARGRILARGDTRYRWGARAVTITRGAVEETVDLAGRRLGLELGAVRLVYQRDGAGRLLAILRSVRGGALARVSLERPEPWVTSADLGALADSGLVRADVQLLLGPPERTRDDWRGYDQQSDHYGSSCWLNEDSDVLYDPTGMIVGFGQSCICGMCVDAGAAVAAADIEGVDHHWIDDVAWVALDGLALTVDHEVLTAAGWRRAGEVRAGELLLGATGPRVVTRVVALPTTGRWGMNVRTAAGWFEAGGLIVRSEALQGCRL